MEERLDCPKESTIDLVHVAYSILEHDTPYSGVKAYFVLCSKHKWNKNLDEIIKPLPRLWDNEHLCEPRRTWVQSKASDLMEWEHKKYHSDILLSSIVI